MGAKIAVSWSGGKDSCLALHSVLENEYEVVALLSMVSKEHGRNHAHGIPFEPLELQAESLGLPLILIDSSGGYENRFKQGLTRVRDEFGAEAVAFGSLYAEKDRKWNEQAARAADLIPYFPLWTTSDRASGLLRTWIDLGYSSLVCRASEQYFDATWVGRPLNMDFHKEIRDMKICPMGEYGEYHTIVTGGPIFRKRLDITSFSTVRNAGLWSMDIRASRLI